MRQELVAVVDVADDTVVVDVDYTAGQPSTVLDDWSWVVDTEDIVGVVVVVEISARLLFVRLLISVS